MKNATITLAIFFTILGILIGIARQGHANTDTNQVNVGVYHCPPFLIQPDDPSQPWTGLCVDMMHQVYGDKHLNYVAYNNLSQMLQSDSSDIATGAISVTSQRVLNNNFSQPFYNTSVSIAHRNSQESESFINWSMLSVIFNMVVLLLIFGTVFNILEGYNPFKDLIKKEGVKAWDFFKASLSYIIHSIYFSTVVASTVGFGDVVPKKNSTKILVMIFIFTSAVFMANFYAELTTSKTIAAISQDIGNIKKLKKMKIACVNGTTASDLLEEHGIRYVSYDNVERAFDDMCHQEIDAVVYDRPILQWLIINRQVEDMITLDHKRYVPQNYAVLYRGAQKNAIFDSKLLHVMESPWWQKRLAEYGLSH